MSEWAWLLNFFLNIADVLILHPCPILILWPGNIFKLLPNTLCIWFVWIFLPFLYCPLTDVASDLFLISYENIQDGVCFVSFVCLFVHYSHFSLSFVFLSVFIVRNFSYECQMGKSTKFRRCTLSKHKQFKCRQILAWMR